MFTKIEWKAGLIALALNLIWEFSHYHLYTDLSGISPTPHLLLASFTDAFILMCIFKGISLKNPGKKDALLLLFTSLFVAIVIEKINLDLGRWAYTSSMPTLFGLGLSPLIQLACTGLLTLKLTSSFGNKA